MALLSVLRSAIDYLGKASVEKQARLLLDSFTTFLDTRLLIDVENIRRLYKSEFGQAPGDVEGDILGVMMSLILKINDAHFRPFFVHLVDWATNPPAPSGGETSPSRLLTLFNLLRRLSDRLKVCQNIGIFVLCSN